MQEQKKGTHEYPDDLDELMLKYASGELTGQEWETLEAWAAGSPENSETLKLLDGKSVYGKDINLLFSFSRDRVWRAIVRAERTRRLRKKVVWGAVCTAAACLAVLMLIIHPHTDRDGIVPEHNGLYTTYEPGGKSARIDLHDGSTVRLSDCETIREFMTGGASIQIDGDRISFNELQNIRSQDTIETLNTAYVPVGAEFTIVLSDGTKVWLNSDSKLIFPTVFKKGTRGVELVGEGYFEVAEDNELPFVVSSGGQKVTVLGTAFNISAYPQQGEIVTTLVEGAVALDTGTGRFILSPGQQATFDISGRGTVVADVDPSLYYAWTKGMFAFYDESLDSIFGKMARWYGVDIDTTSPTLRGIRYTGVIRKEKTFNQIADLMRETNELFFREADGRIYVTAGER